jgi:hypothetical protein
MAPVSNEGGGIMKIRNMVVPILIICVFALVGGCGDDPETPAVPETQKSGIISVLVIDEGLNQTVEDVLITLTPGNIVLKTNKDGIAEFEVPAGDYFVDALVCCIGPGGIEYHLPATVRVGETTRVKMLACLICL